MKNVILKYGAISGLISAGLMLASTLIMLQFGDPAQHFESGAYIGYTCIFLAMAVIYAAIRYYRQSINGGRVSFVQGLLIGLGITVISCIFYSLMWLGVYYNFMPNFMDEYINYQVSKMEAAGSSAESIQAMKTQMDGYKAMYSSPFNIFLITMIEPAPVGVLVSLISALFLKKS